MTQCEMCGCYGARETSEWKKYEVPEMWDALCQECVRHENTHTVETMDNADLVAAIMLDSGYYANAHHAANHVRRWRQGATHAACERGLTEFGKEYATDEGNLDAMMESARRSFLYWSEEAPDKVDRARSKAERAIETTWPKASAGA